MTTHNDMVHQPPHYQSLDENGIECLDAMIAAFGIERVQEYAEINAFKYGWRAGRKGDSALGMAAQDKMKAIFYLRFSMGDDPRDDLA